MNEEKINLIVHEVLRRIKLLQNLRRGLIIIRKEIERGKLSELVALMKDKGFVFDCIFMLDEEKISIVDKEKILKEIGLKDNNQILNRLKNIQMYDVVLISNLNIMEIEKISSLKIENNFLYLIFKILKEGKLVYSFSKDLDITNNNGLFQLASKLITILENIGLRIITKKRNYISLSQNVITLESVKGLEKTNLKVENNAIITNLANDYMNKHSIEIIRK